MRRLLGLVDRRSLPVLRKLSNRWDKATSLVEFSIFQNVPIAAKQAVITQALATKSGDRSVGALVGMAVGDWVGVPLEFYDAVDGTSEPQGRWNPDSFSYTNPNTTEKERGAVQLGQWSDDTSMALCIADSLIISEKYDGSDLRSRFWNWHAEGYNNCFRNDSYRSSRTSFGLGYNIAVSLLALDPEVTPPPIYKSDSQDAGNGSIMRLAPVPIFLQRDPQAAIQTSALSSLSTHPGPLAAECCKFLSFILTSAISNSTQNIDAKSFLTNVASEYLEILRKDQQTITEDLEKIIQLISSSPKNDTEAIWNWKTTWPPLIAKTFEARGEKYNGYPNKKNYFGSFSLDGFALALCSVYHSTSFEDAITRAVNLLGDADTIGAIAGQIAGAIYGFSGIDQRYIEKLRDWDDDEIACRASILYLMSQEK